MSACKAQLLRGMQLNLTTPKAQLYLGDCFELMHEIPDHSVDFICSDMPYGITDAAWDCKIDLQALWPELKRIIKPKGAVALFGSGKFAYMLANSNFKDFRYRYCWFKRGVAATGFLNCRHRPLVSSEDVLIFSSGRCTYNVQRSYQYDGTPSRNYKTRCAPRHDPAYNKNWGGAKEAVFTA